MLGTDFLSFELLRVLIIAWLLTWIFKHLFKYLTFSLNWNPFHTNIDPYRRVGRQKGYTGTTRLCFWKGNQIGHQRAWALSDIKAAVSCRKVLVGLLFVCFSIVVGRSGSSIMNAERIFATKICRRWSAGVRATKRRTSRM